MKKLLALVTLMVASYVSAAALNWGTTIFNSVVAPPTGDLAGSTAYLVAGNDTAATIAAISGNSWQPPAIGEGGSVISRLVSEKGVISRDASVLDSSFIGGTSYDFYVVLISNDGNYFMVSSVKSVAPYDGTAEGREVTWGTDEIGATTGGWVAIGVPEPTVMALLALGVAGLALRRKVA